MKKRYIVYACVLLLIILGSVIPFTAPARPFIQLPGEVIAPWPGGKEFLGGLFGRGFTNTFLAALITFVILVILAMSLRARSRTADEVPSGFYNFFEMVIEFAYNYVENAAGHKWAKPFFAFFMSFILWITIANWMELVPGVDAIGKWEHYGEVALHQAERETGHHIEGEEAKEIEEAALEQDLGHFRVWPFLISNAAADESAPLGEEVHHVHTGLNPEAADWTLVPYIRAAATDLNFTLALAIISVVMTQYFGMRAQGMSYWKKFFNWDGDKIAQNPLAVINSGVGILELFSEIFKIVSFAFRLLGNIFAGQVLLFVIGSLLPVGNLLFWFLEFAVGILQAAVFALLTLTFMSGATEEAHH